MLKKLFTYEWRAMGRYLFPMFGLTLFMSIATGIVMQFTNTAGGAFLSAVLILFTLLYSAIIFVTLCSGFVISIYRFKRNLFDKEGYIMNTLPVTPLQNILAKLLVSVLFEIIAIAVSCMSGIVFLLVLSRFNGITDVFKAIGQLKFYLNATLMKEFIIFALEMLLLSLAAFAAFNLKVYTAISVGHSSTTHKVAKSIGVYIAIHIISQIIFAAIAAHLFPYIDNVFGILNFQKGSCMILSVSVLLIIYCIIYTAITNYFLKNKLNLQ